MLVIERIGVKGKTGTEAGLQPGKSLTLGTMRSRKTGKYFVVVGVKSRDNSETAVALEVSEAIAFAAEIVKEAKKIEA